jgi:hypothetical protein
MGRGWSRGKGSPLVTNMQLETSLTSGYKFSLAMKRLGGIVCCLFLLLASAASALERCQGFDAHPTGHEHSGEVSHSHTQDVDLLREQSSPEDSTIHCSDSPEIASFVSQPPPRLARSIVAYRIFASSFAPVMAETNGWVTDSEKRPPGSFLSAVSPYLSLAVLRF